MSHLNELGIKLLAHLQKGDYYVRRNNSQWVVVERKDKAARVEYAIKQLESTVRQLRQQGRDVTQAIVVLEKRNDVDSSMYRRYPICTEDH